MTTVAFSTVDPPSTPKLKIKRSILSPAFMNEAPNIEKSEKRLLSETTGLAKFSLSPNRNDHVSQGRKNGLPVYMPVDQAKSTSRENTEGFDPSKKNLPKDIQDLLSAYAKKLSVLAKLQKQAEVAKFEMAELEAQIAALQQMDQSPTKKTNPQSFAAAIKKKASTALLATQKSLMEAKIEKPTIDIRDYQLELMNERSKIGPVNSGATQSTTSSNIQDMFSRFLNQFNQTVTSKSFKDIVNDVGRNIDDNNAKIKKMLETRNSELTNKTSRLFTGLMQNLGPTASEKSEPQAVDTSFEVVNMLRKEAEMSILISEDGDYSHGPEVSDISQSTVIHGGSFIDIDDYESDENR